MPLLGGLKVCLLAIFWGPRPGRLPRVLRDPPSAQVQVPPAPTQQRTTGKPSLPMVEKCKIFRLRFFGLPSTRKPTIYFSASGSSNAVPAGRVCARGCRGCPPPQSSVAAFIIVLGFPFVVPHGHFSQLRGRGDGWLLISMGDTPQLQ